MIHVYKHSLDFCVTQCKLSIHFLNHRLDYPGVGPEHSFLKDIGRAEYDSVTDQEALDGMFISLYLSIFCNVHQFCLDVQSTY